MATSLSNQCSSCMNTNATKLCSGCKSIWYCSIECQSTHWSSHKKECKLLSKKRNKTCKKNEKNKKSFAINIQQKYEKEQKKQSKTKLNIEESINGITKFQILNDFLVNNTKKLQFQFKHHISTNSKWKSVYFTCNKITKRGHFWIRMRMFLYSYQIKCKIRAKYADNTDTKWFDWSKQYIINIPSSLVNNKCKVGEYIKYRPKHEFYANGRGKIVQILDDDYLKIKTIENKENIVHTSQLSTTRISYNYLIEIIDNKCKWIVDQRFILQNNDLDVLNLYILLSDIYCGYAAKYVCYNVFTTLNGPYNDVGKYVSGNVIGFLYSLKYIWKIGCRLNHEHGLLKLYSLMNHFTCTNIESSILGVNNGVKADSTTEWCDICHVSSNIFLSTFHCDAEIVEAHDYCMKCVNGMITQHNQLIELLEEILIKDDVNHNCIEIIVTFVVGKVVKVYR
eukprot:72918_1